MNFVDLILILVSLAGIYIGWCAGFLKSLVDSILFFVSTIIASILSKIIVSPIYGILPFLNFSGKAQGIKSLNIIFYRVVIHVLILFMLVAIFNKISTKIKLKEKLVNSMVEINFISRVFGVILYIPVIIIFLFNALLILHLPNFNIVSLHESKISSIIMEKTPVLSGFNSSLYESEKYAVEAMGQENTIDTYSDINDDIVSNLIENELIDSDLVETLRDNNKLLGTRNKDFSDDYSDDDYFDDDYSDDDYDACEEDPDACMEEPDICEEDPDACMEEPDICEEDPDACMEAPDICEEDPYACMEEPDICEEDPDACME